MKTLKTVFLSALTLMLATTANAQQGRRPAGSGRGRPDSSVLNALDKNGDGEISAAELNAATAALKKLDKNGDGEITLDEIRPGFGRGSGDASGRPAGGRSGRPGGRSDGNESLGSLKVGSKLPDVKVFDGSGKELSTKDLRGKYAVLVFGCLT